MADGWEQFAAVKEAPAPGQATSKAAPALRAWWDQYSAQADYSNLRVDRDTGGSLKAHALASMAAPENRMAIIQKFHPGAFLYTHPGTSRKQAAGLPPPNATSEPEILFPVFEDKANPNKATGLRAFTPRGLALSDLADLSGTGVRMLAQTAGMVGGGMVTENPVGAAAAGIGASSMLDAGVGELANRLALNSVGVEEQRPGGQVARDMALRGTENALLGGGAAAVGAGAGYAMRAARNNAFGAPLLKEMAQTQRMDVAGKGRPDVAAAIERQNIAPEASAPLITESPTVHGLVDAASRFPRAADRWANAVNKMRETMDSAFRRGLESTGSTEREPIAAGLKSQRGILDWAAARGALQRDLESRVERNIGSDTLVDAGGLHVQIRQLMARATGPDGQPLASASQTVPPFLRTVAEDLEANGGRLPFGHLRDLREQWDARAGWGQPDVSGMPQQYREAANAARHDLALAAESKGGVAKSDWQQAMSNWAEREKRMDMLGKIASHPQAEKAFQAIVAGDRLGPTLLNEFKQTVSATNPGAWNDVVAVRLQQQSMDASGKFDPVAFGKLWGEGKGGYPLSVKNILAPPGSDARQMFDDLATIGQRMRETRFNVEGSPTARRAEYMNAAAEGGPGIAVKAMAAGVSTATHPVDALRRFFGDVSGLMRGMSADEQMKLYTNPEFRRWLIDGQKTPPANPNGLGAHLARLTQIGTRDTNLQAPLRKLAQQVSDDLTRNGEEPERK
ncbi:MAG: hypothetical protein OEV94_12035 [Deltaproteobacteria bacterium]|nr:hypothetical protein [Deltaproteobacteria bacterium]